MSQIFKKGFTLIELLLTLAIITILASIVLISTNSSKSKGEDAAIKSELLAFRTQAELYGANNNGSYNNLFTGNSASNGSGNMSSGDVNIQLIINSIDKKTTYHTGGSSVTAWAIQVRSNFDTSKYFCFDSLNNSKLGTNLLSPGGTVCP